MDGYRHEHEASQDTYMYLKFQYSNTHYCLAYFSGFIAQLPEVIELYLLQDKLLIQYGTDMQS